MSDNFVAHDTAEPLDHTHVVIDVRKRGRKCFSEIAPILARQGELPKTARATCGEDHRVIYRLPPGTPISRRKLGEGVVVRGCDADSVLAGYTLANTQPQADGRQWLWDAGRFAELMGQSSAPVTSLPESDVPPEPDVGQAPNSTTEAAAPSLDAVARGDTASPPVPAPDSYGEPETSSPSAINADNETIVPARADCAADLDAEETTDMANPVNVNAELRGDAPGASTGKVLSFPDRQGSTKSAPIKQPYPSKREAALDLARRGIPVFPLKPNEKTPAIINWQELATTDPERIKKCWSEDPKRNIGIPTDGYIVIDVDPRNGGGDTFSELMLVEEFPPTARSKTQGGGDHIIYALPKGTRVKGGTHLLGQGLI